MRRKTEYTTKRWGDNQRNREVGRYTTNRIDDEQCKKTFTFEQLKRNYEEQRQFLKKYEGERGDESGRNNDKKQQKDGKQGDETQTGAKQEHGRRSPTKGREQENKGATRQENIPLDQEKVHGAEVIMKEYKLAICHKIHKRVGEQEDWRQLEETQKKIKSLIKSSPIYTRREANLFRLQSIKAEMKAIPEETREEIME